MKTVPCKLCGKPILWAKDEKGTTHPLDPRAPIFSFNGGDLDGVFQVHRQEGCFVTHFATCKNVADLKRKPKVDPQPPEA